MPSNLGNDLLFHAVSHLNFKDVIALLDDKEADVDG